MCGRATGWRGELRLAKLSLAVSDSFLSDRRKRERRKSGMKGEVEEGGWTRRALRYTPELPSLGPPLPRSSGPQSRATDFQFFFELLHATNSRSNSLSRSLPRLRLSSARFLLRLLVYSLPPFLFLSSFSLSPVLASRSEPRIDLMRIIPALIAEAHGISSACPTGWLVGSLTGWLTAVRKSFLIKR